MFFLLLGACVSNIASLYEAERVEVLGPVPSAPPGWEPELRLAVATPALERLVASVVQESAIGVDKAYSRELPLGLSVQAHPTARVTDIELRAGTECSNCLRLSSTLEGTVGWKLGPLAGRVPLTVRAQGEVTFFTERAPDGWRLLGDLIDIKKLKVSVGQIEGANLTPLARNWAQDVLAEIPKLELGHIGRSDLPFRDVRLTTKEHGLIIEALASAHGGEPIPSSIPPLTDDWRLEIHQSTVLAIMRRQAFHIGPAQYDVAIDPRRLNISDNNFELTLRLWRLNRPGWWRDYSVDGTLAITKGQLRFRAKSAQELDQSRGAGIADPLALLVEGRILDSVADGVNQSFPGQRDVEFDEVAITAKARTVNAVNATLVLTGELNAASPVKSKKRKPKTPTRP